MRFQIRNKGQKIDIVHILGGSRFLIRGLEIDFWSLFEKKPYVICLIGRKRAIPCCCLHTLVWFYEDTCKRIGNKLNFGDKFGDKSLKQTSIKSLPESLTCDSSYSNRTLMKLHISVKQKFKWNCLPRNWDAPWWICTPVSSSKVESD